MLSGYRVFSRRFVKSFPGWTRGFEIETELTVHALQLAMPVLEIDTPYQARPEGSESKLNTYRDGARILSKIIQLFKNERPLAFFGGIGAALAAIAVVLAWPLLMTYVETGLVQPFPTALLATGMMVLASLSVTCGVILDNVTTGGARRSASPTSPWTHPAQHSGMVESRFLRFCLVGTLGFVVDSGTLVVRPRIRRWVRLAAESFRFLSRRL